MEPGPDEFLLRIGELFKIDLAHTPSRFTGKGDIAGIFPDIILIKPGTQGISIIENKPYYESTFDGNQAPGGAYIACVKWLNAIGVPCEYLVIHSISWKGYPLLKKIHEILGHRFGSILLEDIFIAMAKAGFKYNPIAEAWDSYIDKGTDYAYN